MLRYNNSDLYNDMNYALMGIDSLLDDLGGIPEDMIPSGFKFAGDIKNLQSLQEKLAKIVDNEKQQKKLDHQLQDWLNDDRISQVAAA